MSVVKVEYPETMVGAFTESPIEFSVFDAYKYGQDESKARPRENGLNDPRMGTIDRAFKCATCEESMAECPGHFGHVELAVPCFHIGTL